MLPLNLLRGSMIEPLNKLRGSMILLIYTVSDQSLSKTPLRAMSMWHPYWNPSRPQVMSTVLHSRFSCSLERAKSPVPACSSIILNHQIKDAVEYRGLALGVALVAGVVGELWGLVSIQNAPRIGDNARRLVHNTGVYELCAKTPDALEVLLDRVVVACRRALVLHVLCHLRLDKAKGSRTKRVDGDIVTLFLSTVWCRAKKSVKKHLLGKLPLTIHSAASENATNFRPPRWFCACRAKRISYTCVVPDYW
jgi:hypothetical protein